MRHVIRLTCLTMLLVALFAVSGYQPTNAQTAEAPIPIKYGDTQKGSLKEKTPSPSFTFQGKAGDDVLIDGGIQASNNGFISDETTLTAPGTSAYTESINLPTVVLLPADGQYTINFTNVNGEGTFNLSLSTIGAFDFSKPLTATISASNGDSFYATKTRLYYMLPAKEALQFQVSYGPVGLDKGSTGNLTPDLHVLGLSGNPGAATLRFFSFDVAEVNGLLGGLSFTVPKNDDQMLLMLEPGDFSYSNPGRSISLPVTLTITQAK